MFEHATRRRMLYATCVLVPACAAMVAHAWHYMPFISDDALISLRYAHRFIGGLGLTWTGGPPVEGYSNLLWVLMVSAVGWLGVDLIVAARGLGLVLVASGLGAVVFATRADTLATALCALIGSLVLALSGPVAVWAIGGLEQPLVLALLSWALVLSYPVVSGHAVPRWRIVAPSLPLALLCLTRPDGPLFAASVGLVMLLVNGIAWPSVKRAALLCGFPIAAVLGQLVFRLAYYRDWVPNTARVKLVPSEKHLNGGWDYLCEGSWSLGIVLLAAALAVTVLLQNRETRPRALLLLVPTTVWSLYVVIIGGDIFPAWRHFVPIVVTSALAIAMATDQLLRRLPRWWVAMLLLVVSTGGLSAHFARQCADEQIARATVERWEWDGQVTGILLKTAFGESQPLLAVDSAGCVPYWSELPSLDMLGLNDRHIAHNPPPDVGRARLAHGFGDGQYVWDREPDLILFGPRGRKKARFLAGKQMQAMPEWERRYSLVRAEGRVPRRLRCWIYVNRHSDTVGIRETGDRRVIPAYLFNGNTRTIARLNADGDLVIRASQEVPASIENLNIDPGRWSLESSASGPHILTVRRHGTGRLISTGSPPLVLNVAPQFEELDITIDVEGDERVEISEVVFRRIEAGTDPPLLQK